MECLALHWTSRTTQHSMSKSTFLKPTTRENDIQHAVKETGKMEANPCMLETPTFILQQND